MPTTARTPLTSSIGFRLAGRLIVTGAAVAAVLGVAACGGTESADVPTASSTSVADSTVSAGSSAVAVPGPKPRPASAVPADEQVAGEKCGTTKGPDGALQIVVTQGSLNCGTAKQIAGEYGPKIATGEPQTVSGWRCAPSQTEGELATCTKGGDAFSLAP